MLWFEWIFPRREPQSGLNGFVVCGGLYKGWLTGQQQPTTKASTMTKSAESSQKKDATKKLAKLYAQTLALRALRWKTAKGMAPIITRMLEDAKALVALKAELTAGVRDL